MKFQWINPHKGRVANVATTGQGFTWEYCYQRIIEQVLPSGWKFAKQHMHVDDIIWVYLIPKS